MTTVNEDKILNIKHKVYPMKWVSGMLEKRQTGGLGVRDARCKAGVMWVKCYLLFAFDLVPYPQSLAHPGGYFRGDPKHKVQGCWRDWRGWARRTKLGCEGHCVWGRLGEKDDCLLPVICLWPPSITTKSCTSSGMTLGMISNTKSIPWREWIPFVTSNMNMSESEPISVCLYLWQNNKQYVLEQRRRWVWGTQRVTIA